METHAKACKQSKVKELDAMQLEDSEIEVVKKLLLTGNTDYLISAFLWGDTLEDFDYWNNQFDKRIPLDRDRLIDMLHENGVYPGETLKEINPQKGDKLKLLGYVNSLGEWVENPFPPVYEHKGEKLVSENFDTMSLNPVSRFHFEVVSRANTPKTWGEMTPEEKGLILLANHEGKTIEWIDPEDPEDTWDTTFYPDLAYPVNSMAYRVKPEPKVILSYVIETTKGTTPSDDFTQVPYLESKVETKVVFGCRLDGRPLFNEAMCSVGTHKLTYNIIDGVVDCSSVKLEEI